VLVRPEGGGVADVARNVAGQLGRRGWDVAEIALGDDATIPAWSALRALLAHRRELAAADLVHVELGALGLAAWWFAFWFALRPSGSRAPLVLVAHDPPRIVLAPASGLVNTGGRVRRILAYRALSPLLDRRLRRTLARRVSVGVVLSEHARADWSPRGPRRIVVADHGADLPVRDPRPPSAGEYVLFAGFIGPAKGVDVLLDAWRELGDAPLRLVVAGIDAGSQPDGRYLRQLRKLGAELASPPQWRGWVDKGELARVVADAAIVVLPYRRSNPASGILVRAMVEGRAIVATRVPAALDALTDGQDALLVAPGDPGGLAGALARLIEDPPLRDRLGAAAAARAAGRFTWDRHLTGLISAYQAALNMQ
jgi:glycosyltransferase involved in cell wall biosynthesis